MKLAEFDDGTVHIRDADTPEPSADQARVRISAAGVCHSDLHLARGDWVGAPRTGVIGHEAIGVVGGVLGAGFNASVMADLRINKAMKLPTTVKVGLAGLLSGIVVALLPHNAIDYAHLRELVIAG